MRLPHSRLETVSRACTVLKAFRDEAESLTLADLVRRTGFEKTVAFRLVHTLAEEGLLLRAGRKRYSANVRMLGRRSFRIGFAAQVSGSAFSEAVTEGLRWAAEKNNVELIVLDNRYSANAALRNARELIAARVHLAIEFQTHEKAAPIISSLFGAAEIPLIAVEIPHPGATYFGIDNYRVGIVAGNALVKWCKQHWGGEADEVLLLELGIAGSLPHLRLSGAEASIRQSLSVTGRFHYLETRGEFTKAREVARKYLRSSRRKRTLIVGVNDPAALGALRAFKRRVGLTAVRLSGWERFPTPVTSCAGREHASSALLHSSPSGMARISSAWRSIFCSGRARHLLYTRSTG